MLPKKREDLPRHKVVPHLESQFMPTTPFDSVKDYLAPHLKDFESRFRDSMRSKVPLLDTIMTYIVKRKGKQMRPMFVLLSADLFGDINERSFRGASLVELLHTATLVHDDVVDEANYRRGFLSINALWKNKIAVLVGDYLLSKGLLLSLKNEEYGFLKILSTAVEQMSEGELLQLEKARKVDTSEEIYYEVIQKKTASLLSSCCAIGTASTTQDESTLEKMGQFGEKIGLAFQIKDDLFDYGARNVGKPLAKDLKDKKLTLPLLHALKVSAPATKREIIRTIKKGKQPKDYQRLIAFVEKEGGIEYAKKKMNQFLEEGLSILHSIPNKKSTQHLETLVRYVVEREK